MDSSIRFTSFGHAASGSAAVDGHSRLKLYCFPSAGGGAALYRGLAKELRGEVELRAALLPGRDGRFGEPPLATWAEIAASGAAALRADRPTAYALMGHSMGALVAFEVARALRREGFPPARLLVASARVAPQCTAAAGPVAHLPDQELAEVMEARSGGMPPEVLADRETLALFMPVLRCDMRLLEQYQYQEEATLDTPLLALAGEDDPLTTLAQAHAWREQTSASFEVDRFSGDHWFIRMHTASIARSILRRLTSSGMGRSHTTDSRSQTGG